MPIQRKVFRIEQAEAITTAGRAFDALPAHHRHEIFAELRALRESIERRACESTIAAKAPIEALAISDLYRLKSDTDAIHLALARTKQEVAALHQGMCSTPARASRELDAVAESAELATQRILDAAEAIEEAAKTLSACLKNEQEAALALDVQDQVLRIFEACNFQDLSGQRITKVLATLKFIEERVARMVEIWGGLDALAREAEPTRPERDPGTELHGPKLPGDRGHVSQDEVDAIFAVG